MNENPIQLGEYEILEELGSGVFGTVYQAHGPQLHHIADRPSHIVDKRAADIVALKILDPAFTQDPLFVHNLRMVAPTIVALKHTHTVHVYDVDEDRGWHFIVMEYIVGGTLARLLKSQCPLPLPAVCTVVRHTAAALDHAHVQGLVHGDVKPSNIFLQTIPEHGGRVKLSDLGLAWVAMSSSVETQGRLITATAQYMSPEQTRGETTDARSDVYSLGIVTYEMLTGQVPFISESLYGYIQSHSEKPPPPLDWFNERVSPGVQNVVLKALAKDPTRRFPSAGAFAEALAAAARRPFQPTIPETLAPPPAPIPYTAPAPSPPPRADDEAKRGGGFVSCALGFVAGLAAVLACAALMVIGALIIPGMLLTAITRSAPAPQPTLPAETSVPPTPGQTSAPTASPHLSTLPIISLSPANGPSGTSVLVQGHKFTPNDVVLLTWDGHVITPTQPALVVVDLDGQFQASFYVPTDGQGGHAITAGTAHETAVATFTITAGDARPTGTPLGARKAAPSAHDKCPAPLLKVPGIEEGIRTACGRRDPSFSRVPDRHTGGWAFGSHLWTCSFTAAGIS